MAIDTLITKYLVTRDAPSPRPGETAPQQRTQAMMKNHRVEALIDGAAFFKAIDDEITYLLASTARSRFFYMSAWWLGLADYDGVLKVGQSKPWDFDLEVDGFTLPRTGTKLIDRIVAMAQAGITVRILPWVSPLMKNQKVAETSGIGTVNFHSLLSVEALRRRLPDPDQVVVNTLAHSFGAVHCKLVICGDATRMRAYTSGLDPAPGRLEKPGIDASQADFLFAHGPLSASDLQTQSDAFPVNELRKELYDQLQGQWTLLPIWDDIPNLEANGLFDWETLVVKPQREWVLTFYKVENINGQNVWVDRSFTLRKQGSSFDVYDTPQGGWHDLGLRLEGTAASDIHDFFRTLWNEQLSRPVETFTLDSRAIVSHQSSWRPLIARPAVDLPINTGQQYVQILRTVPQMNFNASAKRRGKILVPNDFKLIKLRGKRFVGPQVLRVPVGVLAPLVQKGYKRPPLSFARNGLFEFQVALRQAISAAENYIFIADQGLYGLEIMDWIRARALRKPNLKVILLHGADPADPPNNFQSEAYNKHLFLQNFPRSVKDRLASNMTYREWLQSAVHCKVTLIDDVWCAVGSANCMRRSLYTDIELSLCVLQEATPAAQLPTTAAEEADPAGTGKTAPSFIQKFRRDLWAHYGAIPRTPGNPSLDERNKMASLLNLDRALSIWSGPPGITPNWGVAPVGIQLRSDIVTESLNPYPSDPQNPFRQHKYDLEDADSRQQY